MAVQNFDMFTLLPDSLLFLIVSFLPFKEAARTSILSQRWLNIWHATKNIEFNELFFVKLDESDETRDAKRQAFLNFIKHWVDSHQEEPLVDKFCLKLSIPDEENDQNVRETIESSVAFAIQRGVKDLNLDFSNANWEEENFDDHAALFQLPKHVYGQRSLESLRLFSCGFVMPDLLNFRGLKDVCFGWMKVTICDIKTLLSNCKMIESLSLKKCWNMAHFDMGEEDLRLRRLVIDKCHFHTDFLRFKAPNLRFLKYSGVVGISEIVISPLIMEEADIDFSLEFELDQFGDVLYQLVADLYPVRVLTVCSYLLQGIPNGEEPVRVQFDLNVRHLIMKTALHHNEFCGISFLLNSCPFLENLTLEIGLARLFPGYESPYSFDPQRFWTDNAIFYKCVRLTLKVVEVKGFRGTFNEILVLHYLVRCGRVLQKININLLKEEEDGDGRKLKRYRIMAEFLLTVPKASRNLKISIY